MRKIVQHGARISRIPRCVMTTTLLSALVLVPAVVTVSMMFITPLTQAQSQAPAGYSLKVLYNFTGPDGSEPYIQRPVWDAAGKLYGTTEFGGAYGVGTVFMVDVNGKETVLHSFSGPDGMLPTGPLLRDASGNLYGTTFFGGNQSACQGNGCGVVFKVDTKGNFTVLYTFTGDKGDGEFGGPGLIQDSAGNLFGVTIDGGTGTCTYQPLGHCGTVFKLDPKGNETVLHSFTGADGASPLITSTTMDRSGGYIYGDAAYGGNSSGACALNNGCGTVWKLDPTTGKETVLHRFNANHGDGANPFGGGYIDARGNLYETAYSGGDLKRCVPGNNSIPGCGIVFRIDTSGKYTVLHKFRGIPSDGLAPAGPLIQDEKGNFYGATEGGGPGEYGTVFKMSTSDNEHFQVTLLFSFTADGSEPEDPEGVVMDAKGNLYGFSRGGAWRAGTVFKLTRR